MDAIQASAKVAIGSLIPETPEGILVISDLVKGSGMVLHLN